MAHYEMEVDPDVRHVLVRDVPREVIHELAKKLEPRGPNDWRLLADKLGLSNDDIRFLEARQVQPHRYSCAMLMFDELTQHRELRALTVGRLAVILSQMDRVDVLRVLEDNYKKIDERDKRQYSRANCPKENSEPPSLQENLVSSITQPSTMDLGGEVEVQSWMDTAELPMDVDISPSRHAQQAPSGGGNPRRVVEREPLYPDEADTMAHTNAGARTRVDHWAVKAEEDHGYGLSEGNLHGQQDHVEEGAQQHCSQPPARGNGGARPKDKKGNRNNECDACDTTMYATFPRVKSEQEKKMEKTKKDGRQRQSVPPDMKPGVFELAKRNIRVFVTYSDDNERHTRNVLNMVKCLKSNQFSCSFDAYEKAMPVQVEDIYGWLDYRVKHADFVIVVISPQYLKDSFASHCDKQVREVKKGHGIHTRYIHRLLQIEYDENGCRNRRFRPVIFPLADFSHVPTWLKNTKIYDWNPTSYKDLFYSMIAPQESMNNFITRSVKITTQGRK